MRLSRDPAARRRLYVLCALAALASLAGVVIGSRAGGGDQAATGAGPTADGARRPGDGPSAAAERAARLTLPRQLGQLLVMSFDGREAPDYIRRRLRSGEGTGVILFGNNVTDARSLKALTATLQRSARDRALVAVDQEGGEIRSVGFAAPASGQPALATPAAAAAAAGEGARALRAVGVNVNLAPVADVAASGSVMSGRAYPGDAGAVAATVAAAVRAHARAGVAATVKHFPGLGRATQNTDDVPVTVDASRAELERSDLPPFAAAFEARVPLVMTSHALYPALDGERIASQSPLVSERLLRGELGFRGAVVTDSIEAQAVLARSGVAVAAERSLAAGADLVLMTGSGSWNLVYPRLLRRARESASFRARVEQAAGRVLELKRRLGLPAPRG